MKSKICSRAGGLTNGSNRSLRSLGQAKARPLTKRYAPLNYPVQICERRVERFQSIY